MELLKKVIYSFFVALSFTGCFKHPVNAIYTVIPKGSNLTLDNIKQSNQFIFKDNHLFVLYYKQGYDNYQIDPYILYVRDMKLMSANFVNSVKIDSIKDGVIYCAKRNIDREGFSDPDFPLKINYCGAPTGSSRESNKIIDEIEFDVYNKRINIIGRQSSNLYEGLDKQINDSKYIYNFNMSYNISDILFENSDKSLAVVKYNSSTGMVDFEYIKFKNIEAMDAFYIKFYELLK